MTIAQPGLDASESFALNHFDLFSHIAVGDGDVGAVVTDTALNSEVFRNALNQAVKNTGAGTYFFEIKIGLTEANGFTIKEIGVFDAASAGNMATKDLLPIQVAKTSNFVLEIGVTVTITSENN